LRPETREKEGNSMSRRFDSIALIAAESPNGVALRADGLVAESKSKENSMHQLLRSVQNRK